MKTAVCIKPIEWNCYPNRQKIDLMEIVPLSFRRDRFPEHTGVTNQKGFIIYLGKKTFDEHFKVLE
jgi:hypothetical protein